MRPRHPAAWVALLYPSLLAACVQGSPPQNLYLDRTSFADLPGWNADHVAATLPALRRTCGKIMSFEDDYPLAPIPVSYRGYVGRVDDWRQACTDLTKLDDADDEAARRFFERDFVPYWAYDNSTDRALVTGYYEPIIEGSLHHTDRFSMPLLRWPPDLIESAINLGRSPWRGEGTAQRDTDRDFAHHYYWTRAEIEAGALDRFHNLALAWVDPVDGFFLQIQGSGRVKLEDGSIIRLGYNGENGHPYVSIGRLLVDQGAMTLDQVSAQSIKAWLRAHPDQAKDLMDQNPSYVFFEELSGEGPIGAEFVPLTPGRSLAIDARFMPLGVPVWLDLTQNGQEPIQRLTITQDTGGAIKGTLRGDLFWGLGPEAEGRAGGMRALGQLYLLLPRSIGSPYNSLQPPESNTPFPPASAPDEPAN